MNKNLLFSIIVIVAFAFGLFGPATPVIAADGVIKVANLSPMSGQTATYGKSTSEGFLLAVKQKNEAGGVLGMKIETIVADSQCSPDPAVNALNKVISEDKIHYVIGEVCSSASIPMSEIATKEKVLMISPTSTGKGVTIFKDGTVKPYVFRACFEDSFQGLIGAKFAIEKGYKTAFIMFDQGNDYVLGLAESFEKNYLAAGGKVVGKESYTKTDTDFSTILAKVADSKAEVIYLPDYYPIVNLVGAQAKEKGVNAPMLGGDGWESSDQDLKAAAGGYFTTHMSTDDPRPEVQNFVKSYKEAYGVIPDSLAVLAYDATNLLFAAIEKAGKDDTEAVNKALEEIKFAAVSGTISYDKFHNPIKPLAIIKVTAEKYVLEKLVTP